MYAQERYQRRYRGIANGGPMDGEYIDWMFDTYSVQTYDSAAVVRVSSDGRRSAAQRVSDLPPAKVGDYKHINGAWRWQGERGA